MKRIITAGILLLLAGWAAAYGYTCKFDNTSLYFTGESKQEFGKMEKKYRCKAGKHVYWITE